VTSVAVLAGSRNEVSKSSVVPSFCTIRIIRRVRRSTSTMDWRVAFDARRSFSRSRTNNSRSEGLLTLRTIHQPPSSATAEPTNVCCVNNYCQQGRACGSPVGVEEHMSVGLQFVNKYCQ